MDARVHASLAYRLVVAGMTLSAMNYIIDRLGVSSKSIEAKDIVGRMISPPSVDKVPMCPLGVNFQTTNFMFIFRDGKLFCVMNTKTNIEEVEHYREWAKMPSLIDSNSAYHLATNWLSRVFVDVSVLNKKYKVNVGQPGFWTTPQGTNSTILPLFYVTWNKDDYQAAKVGIFGPTKQFMGLTIEDASLTDRTYLYVTNKKELLGMTNIPTRLIEMNPAVYRLVAPRPTPDSERR